MQNLNPADQLNPSSVSVSVVDSKTFTVEILKIIKESQQQHGLRHLDYQRYRSYCTRRLRRLRKSLHMAGNQKQRYQKKEINVDEIQDGKVLLLPLYQAERAWSLAMQLKQESNSEPRKKFHLVNRLRKAAKYSNELERLSESNKFDARTKLEAQGYNSLVNGQFFFETQKWKESLNYFDISKKIYEKLSSALKGDDSQVFYTLKVEEIIPNIRYCNYNLGDETAKKDLIDMKLKSVTGSELAQKIEELISQTKEKQIVTFSEVEWRNNIVLQIKNEKVKSFLTSLQEYEKQINQSNSTFDLKMSIFENILKESVDTIQVVRDELKLDQHFQQIQRGLVLSADDKPSNTLLLFSYLSWLRINKTIDRNLLMVDSFKTQLANNVTKVSAPSPANLNKDKNETAQSRINQDESKAVKNAKPQDIVRLYDIIIQNYKDLNNLPGLSNDNRFINENEFLINFYKAFRAYYISLFYLMNKKYREAVGFCFKVENYVRLLNSSIETSTKSAKFSFDVTKYKNELSVLLNELNQSKYKIQTAAILEDSIGTASGESSNESTKENYSKEKLEKTPLNQRLDVYYEDSNFLNPNIIKFPLSFDPIPCKPLFFDLALNHVELPKYDDKIDVPRRTNQQPQQGVKGFFKGLLGFS